MNTMNSAVQNSYTAQSGIAYATCQTGAPNSNSTHLESLHADMCCSKDDLLQILSRMRSLRTRLFGQTPENQKAVPPTSIPNGAIDAMAQESTDMRGLIGDIYITLNDLEKLV